MSEQETRLTEEQVQPIQDWVEKYRSVLGENQVATYAQLIASHRALAAQLAAVEEVRDDMLSNYQACLEALDREAQALTRLRELVEHLPWEAIWRMDDTCNLSAREDVRTVATALRELLEVRKDMRR